MAVVTLPYAVLLGIGDQRHSLDGGQQTVSAEVAKALIEAEIIEASKKAAKPED